MNNVYVVFKCEEQDPYNVFNRSIRKLRDLFILLMIVLLAVIWQKLFFLIIVLTLLLLAVASV